MSDEGSHAYGNRDEVGPHRRHFLVPPFVADVVGNSNNVRPLPDRMRKLANASGNAPYLPASPRLARQLRFLSFAYPPVGVQWRGYNVYLPTHIPRGYTVNLRYPTWRRHTYRQWYVTNHNAIPETTVHLELEIEDLWIYSADGSFVHSTPIYSQRYNGVEVGSLSIPSGITTTADPDTINSDTQKIESGTYSKSTTGESVTGDYTITHNLEGDPFLILPEATRIEAEAQLAAIAWTSPPASTTGLSSTAPIPPVRVAHHAPAATITPPADSTRPQYQPGRYRIVAGWASSTSGARWAGPIRITWDEVTRDVFLPDYANDSLWNLTPAGHGGYPAGPSAYPTAEAVPDPYVDNHGRWGFALPRWDSAAEFEIAHDWVSLIAPSSGVYMTRLRFRVEDPAATDLSVRVGISPATDDPEADTEIITLPVTAGYTAPVEFALASETAQFEPGYVDRIYYGAEVLRGGEPDPSVRLRVLAKQRTHSGPKREAPRWTSSPAGNWRQTQFTRDFRNPTTDILAGTETLAREVDLDTGLVTETDSKRPDAGSTKVERTLEITAPVAGPYVTGPDIICTPEPGKSVWIENIRVEPLL